MQRLSPQVHSDMALLKHRALDNNDVYIELGPSIRTMNAQRLGVDDMYQAELEELGLANSFLSEEESFSVSPRIDTHQERGYWRLKSLLKFSGFIKGAPGYHWKWLPLVSFGVAMLIGFITLYAYRVEIAKAATVLAVWFKNASTWGYVLYTLIMFALCFPPTFGYGNAITFSGFVFGFPHGFIPVFLGAVIGSTCCFLLGRKISKKYINYLMSSSKKLVTFARIVEKKGFKYILLIRLAPYPFNMVNLVLSSLNISLFHFVLATMISLLKVLLHIYIGSTLKNITAIFISDETLVDPSTGQPGNPKPREIPVANFVLLGLSSAFGFFTFIFFYFLVEKEIEKSKKLHTFEEVEYEALRD